MRPRSAGSSLISKLLLPLFTLAAISTATPLKGTAPLVAAVAVKLLAEVRFDAELSCGAAPSACAAGSATSAATCATLAGAAWSWVDAPGVTVAASVVVFWTDRFAASGLPVVDVCAVAALRAESAVALVAFASADVGLAVEPLAATCAFPCVVFGVTDGVAATAAVKAEGSAGGVLP